MFLHYFTYFILCVIYQTDAKDYVTELSDDTFPSEISKLPNALVMFYAPWCPYCKRLKPEFAQAAQNLHDDNLPINLIKVNCEDGGTGTCEKYQVDGYPSVKLFKYGKLQDSYTGPRDAADIIRFMQGVAGQPQSRPVRTFNDFDQLTKQNRRNVLMGFFQDGLDAAALRHFLDAGEGWRGRLQFVYTTEADICREQGLESGAVLFRPAHLRNPFEPDYVVLTTITSKEDIDAFLERHRFGLVDQRRLEEAEDFSRPIIIVYYDVDYVKKPKLTNYIRNRILRVANDYKDLVRFAISDKTEFAEEILDFANLSDGDISKEDIVVVGLGSQGEYKMKENFTVPSLMRFVERFLIKENQQSAKALVKIANVGNFSDLVQHNGRDTLVLLHDSSKFNEIDEFVDIAEILKEEPIDFVKMDVAKVEGQRPFMFTGNEMAVYFLGKEAKNDLPMVYAAKDLSVEKLMKFVCEFATRELVHFDRNGKLKQARDEL